MDNKPARLFRRSVSGYYLTQSYQTHCEEHGKLKLNIDSIFDMEGAFNNVNLESIHTEISCFRFYRMLQYWENVILGNGQSSLTPAAASVSDTISSNYFRAKCVV